jgi:hypothetical protein
VVEDLEAYFRVAGAAVHTLPGRATWTALPLEYIVVVIAVEVIHVREIH